jgi:hypothetical protein
VELYLLIDGERHGPYTLDDVREYLAQPGTGEISVAAAGGPWAPARKIRELRDAWDRGRAAERAPALETRPRPSSQPLVADRPKVRATRATPDVAPTTPAAAPQVVVSSQMPGARRDEVPWRPGNIDDLTRGAGSSLDDAATVVRPQLTLDDVAEFLPSASPVGAAPVSHPPSVAEMAQVVAGGSPTGARPASRRLVAVIVTATSVLALALIVGILLLAKRSSAPSAPTPQASTRPVADAIGATPAAAPGAAPATQGALGVSSAELRTLLSDPSRVVSELAQVASVLKATDWQRHEVGDYGEVWDSAGARTPSRADPLPSDACGYAVFGEPPQKIVLTYHPLSRAKKIGSNWGAELLFCAQIMVGAVLPGPNDANQLRELLKPWANEVAAFPTTGGGPITTVVGAYSLSTIAGAFSPDTAAGPLDTVMVSLEATGIATAPPAASAPSPSGPSPEPSTQAAALPVVAPPQAGLAVFGGSERTADATPPVTQLPVFGPWTQVEGDSAAANEKIKLAREEQRGENVAEALALYQEAAEIDPNNPVPYSSIAYLYLRMGDAASALEPALAALARAPEGATHWMRLGDVYAKLEDQARALAAYDQALTFNPTSEAVILRKGDLLWKPACTAGSAAACQRVQQGAPVSGADRGSP